MIEYIKHKAKEIEDELWEMLKSEYGLARNEETLARIHGTIDSILDDGLLSAGLSDIPSDVDPDLEKIDELMALAMMAVAMANDEENPEEALDSLLLSVRASTKIRTTVKYSSKKLQPGEIEGEIKMMMARVYSRNGLVGANKRHAPMAELRAWAIESYQAGGWQSANQASHVLKDAVIAHGRTINAHLSESNAQRTIYGWFLKDNKRSSG